MNIWLFRASFPKTWLVAWMAVASRSEAFFQSIDFSGESAKRDFDKAMEPPEKGVNPTEMGTPKQPIRRFYSLIPKAFSSLFLVDSEETVRKPRW